MPALSDYTSGTITLTNGSTAFTGSGTGWQAADFREGDTILGIEDNAGVEYVIASITGNGAGTLTQEWGGATGTYAYRMRYLADGARVTAQARNLIELLGNGNLQALAGLTGPGVPVFNGPHAMVIKPETDFINGVAYDVQVDTLADRDAYDGQSAGFSVLVSDGGDGRSAIYSKASNTSGDWTGAAYVTGPVGPQSTVPGVVWRGTYAAGTVYAINDGVTFNGSSFRKLTTAAAGNAPSAANPPVNNTNWEVLAARGLDGTGTGDVVGPTGAVADRIAVFSGTTGKLIKDSGTLVNGLEPARTAVTQAIAEAGTDTVVRGWSALRVAQAVAASDPWQTQPIGVLIPLADNLTGVASPPTNKSYRYIKLTAADAYNSGVLTDETVSGAAPLVSATAVISITGSPLNGQTVRLINTERRFLRAGSAGTIENDTFQGHDHAYYPGSLDRDTTTGAGFDLPRSSAVRNATARTGSDGKSVIGEPISQAGADNGSPRTANETRSKNLGVTYYMRVL